MNGESMASEMAEQPSVVAALVGRRAEIRDAVRALLPAGPQGVVFAARGSSANAAMHGRLATELATGHPAMIASLAVHAAYGVALDYSGWLGVSVSQSGRTPEIVAAAESQRRSGAATIAVTNDPTSPLACATDLCIALGAGAEVAIPATKTYTAQVVLLSMLAEALRQDPAPDRGWDRLAPVMQACLDDVRPVLEIVDALIDTQSMILTGRGFGEPAAREGALKLEELTSITAQPFSHLDLLHGPIAIAGPTVPAIVVALRGPTEADSRRVVDELTSRGAPTWTIGDVDRADVSLGGDLPEAMNGVLAVVRLQQIALLLSLARGVDPDRPNGLAKVTLT